MSTATLALAQSNLAEPQSGMAATPISQAPPTPPPSTRGFDYWQPEWMMRELWGPDRMSKGMEVRMRRHNTFMLKDVPEAYRTQQTMLPPTLCTLGEGKDLYDRNCATCHGADGMGDGNHVNAL
jgi:mono/diheme cytochrome c family protein